MKTSSNNDNYYNNECLDDKNDFIYEESNLPPTFVSPGQLYGVSIQPLSNSTGLNKSNPLIAISSITSNEDNPLNFFKLISIEENQLKYSKDKKEHNYYLKEQFSQDKLEFPISKIMFNQKNPSIIATSDTKLSIYKINSEHKENEQDNINIELLNKLIVPIENSLFQAPLTSFDWNSSNPSLIAGCSIDTTCSIWDINESKMLTRIIAHDKEVYDISFMEGEHVFITTGADKGVRVFDLRDLDNSQILFEVSDSASLTRLSICPFDNNYITALSGDKSYFYVLDIRDTTSPIEIVQTHSNLVNSIKWSDKHKFLFCSASDDTNLFVWDLNCIHSQETLKEYKNDLEINNVDWKDDLIAITSDKTLKILKY